MDNSKKANDGIVTPVLVGLQKFNFKRSTSNEGMACISPYPKTPIDLNTKTASSLSLKKIDWLEKDNNVTLPLPAVSRNISKKHRRSSHLDCVHTDNLPLLNDSPSVGSKNLFQGPSLAPINSNFAPISPLTLPKSFVRSSSLLSSPPLNPLPLPQSPCSMTASSITDYRLIRTIGTGFFGRVYFAQEKNLGTFVALKVLKKETIVKLKQVEHIFNEKNILSTLQSPFCLRLIDSFQDAENVYLSLEYVCGGELFTYLRSRKRFKNHVARFYAAEVIMALEYMHSKDIIYRDLKPENLLLDSEGHIKLCDYGFAKIVKDVTWTLCGTPDYLAPEIIQSKGYGNAVDWWALGVLIFEMLTGFPPFYHKEQMHSYQLIVSGTYRIPSFVNAVAADLISRLLCVKLSKRFGNLKRGVLDIQLHPWFSNQAGVTPADPDYFDWIRLASKQLVAPIQPVNSDPSKSTSFDEYPEVSTESYGVNQHDLYNDIFKNF